MGSGYVHVYSDNDYLLTIHARHMRISTVGSPTAISRDFYLQRDVIVLLKSGQGGWCYRSGDGASLGQE